MIQRSYNNLWSDDFYDLAQNNNFARLGDFMPSAIHSTALIEPGAFLGRDVRVGEFSIVRSGVNVGDQTKIGAFCEIGHQAGEDNLNLIIGPRSLIRSRTTIYLGSTFGAGLSTGHGVTIRENTEAGEGLSVGTSSDIQGKCRIGNFVRMHSNVHVSTGSIIGNYVWLYPGVVLSNDPRPPSEQVLGTDIGDFAVVAIGVILLPGVRVGTGSLIAAGSVLTKSAQDGGLYSGNPARFIGPLAKLSNVSEFARDSYPWRFRFHRGFPEETVKLWMKEKPK